MSRRDGLFLALLLAAPAFFFSEILFFPRIYFMRDLTYLFHPWRSLAAQFIQAGEMPLWNPFEMGGMPFLANLQSAILYPLSIPFWVLPFPQALKAFYLLHYGLAAAGFYLLARKLRFAALPAFMGAVLFAYNGYMLSRVEFMSVLGSLIWFPWILIFFLDADPSAGAWPAALALSLSLFAGYPQILGLQIGAALFFSLILNRPAAVGRAWVVALAGLVLIGAAQWAPSLELLRHSVRGGSGVSFSEGATYSLPLDGLFGLIDPFRILHNPDRFTGEKFFWIWSAWWGFAASFFCLWAVRSHRKALAGGALLLGLAGVVWAMGDQWPWFEALYLHFFPLRLFRYPPVVLYVTVIAAAFLTACGASALADLFEARPKIGGAVLLAGALALTAELGAYGRHIFPTVSPDYYHATLEGIQAVAKDSPENAMLSPGVNMNRNLAGMTSVEARLRFRGSLFDLTNLPYRIKSIVSSGEPLALRSFEDLSHQLVLMRSLELARPLLNFWNVTHFLTRATLHGGWDLLATDHDTKIYRNRQALGRAFALSRGEANALAPEQALLPTELHWGIRRIEARFEPREESLAVFTTPFYPGWRTYRSDAPAGLPVRLPPLQVRDYFYGVPLPQGPSHLYLVYDPASWKAGAGVSLLTLVFLAGLGFLKMARRSEAS